MIATLTGNEILTNSCIECFKACRRKYYFAYERAWRPQQEIDVLRFGDAIHYGIDCMAKEIPFGDFSNEIYARYNQSMMDVSRLENSGDIITKLRYELETVLCLLKNYVEAWQDSSIEIIESEKTFKLPIVNPATGASSRTFEQGGKRDRLARLPDGRLALVETKTTSEDIGPGSDYRNVLGLNAQITMYFDACQSEGIDVETTLYDVIKKPTIRPSAVAVTDEHGDKIVLDREGNRVFTKQGKPRQTGSTEDGYVLQTREMSPHEWYEKLDADIKSRPEYYFQRWEVALLEADREQFRSELWDIANDIRLCRNENRWYRNTSSCRKFNRLCSYYPLCSGQTAINGGVPQGYRQVEKLHEELYEE